jgi:3-phosphoshikimate 1-carboxyvinyltransferase
VNKIIFALKHFPQEFKIDGDNRLTQLALLLGVNAIGETRIRNYNQGIETGQTVLFLQSLGYKIGRDDSEIIIDNSLPPAWPDDISVSFNGDSYTLSLIIGFLAGKGKRFTLRYDNAVNRPFLDDLLGHLRHVGVELKHDKEARNITYQSDQLWPIERKLSSGFPHLKNCLLMFGICSGRSVAVRETRPTEDSLENMIINFGARLTIRESKLEWVEDPRDPRKRIRREAADYKQEMMLHPSCRLNGGTIDIPSDSFSAEALLTLGILKKANFVFRDIYLGARLNRFMHYLRSLGVNIKITHRRGIEGPKRGDLDLEYGEIKGKKVGGEIAVGLMRELPLIAIIAAAWPGTTLIRDIREISLLQKNPFEEIAANLGKMGIKCGVLDDGMVIEGKKELNGADFGPFQNKEMALAFYLVALSGQGKSDYREFEIIANHFPALASLVKARPMVKVHSGEDLS